MSCKIRLTYFMLYSLSAVIRSQRVCKGTLLTLPIAACWRSASKRVPLWSCRIYVFSELLRWFNFSLGRLWQQGSWWSCVLPVSPSTHPRLLQVSLTSATADCDGPLCLDRSFADLRPARVLWPYLGDLIVKLRLYFKKSPIASHWLQVF